MIVVSAGLKQHNSCLDLNFMSMQLSRKNMTGNEKEQNHASLCEERFCMFWAALGSIGWRNLNWCKTDENVRFHASWGLPTLLSIPSECSQQVRQRRIFKVHFFHFKGILCSLKGNKVVGNLTFCFSQDRIQV